MTNKLSNLIIFATIMFLSNQVVKAHIDITNFYVFDNVFICYTTGYSFEEKNKVKIIGKMMQELCVKLNFKDTILLNYDHIYVGKYEEYYSLSISNNYTNPDKYDYNYAIKKILNKEFLTINYESKSIKPIIVLKLLEYGIKNYSILNDSTQKRVTSDSDKKKELLVKSKITHKKINEIINSESSELVNSFIEKEYKNIVLDECTQKEKKENVHYYYQNNKYTSQVRDM